MTFEAEKKFILLCDKGKSFRNACVDWQATKYRSQRLRDQAAASRSAHESCKVYQITFTIERILTVRAAKSKDDNRSRSAMPHRATDIIHNPGTESNHRHRMGRQFTV